MMFLQSSGCSDLGSAAGGCDGTGLVITYIGEGVFAVITIGGLWLLFKYLIAVYKGLDGGGGSSPFDWRSDK